MYCTIKGRPERQIDIDRIGLVEKEEDGVGLDRRRNVKAHDLHRCRPNNNHIVKERKREREGRRDPRQDGWK